MKVNRSNTLVLQCHAVTSVLSSNIARDNTRWRWSRWPLPGIDQTVCRLFRVIIYCDEH